MVFGSAGSGDVFSTRALSKFVAALKGRKGAVVVDLGPAVGANVTFLGESLGCKLHVDNILSSGETWWPLPEVADEVSETEQLEISERMERIRSARQLGHRAESADGVLCWDSFDYLDDEAARVLAAEVVRILKPGGVTFLCHGPKNRVVPAPVQYEIVDEMTLRYRQIEAERPALIPRESRAVTRLFDGLTITTSFLLTSRMREVVFRKPSVTSAA